MTIQSSAVGTILLLTLASMGLKAEAGVAITLPRPSGGAVSGAPYSGELIVEDRGTTYRAMVHRNSEGKTRVDGLGGNGMIAEITDPAALVSYVLDLQNHVAHRVALQGLTMIMAGCCPEKAAAMQSTEYFLLTAAGKAMPTGSPFSTGESASLGNRIIDGLAAEGYRWSFTMANGPRLDDQFVDVSFESWYVPEWKVTTLLRISQSRSGDTTVRLTNIQPGEPDGSLFQIPAGYRMVEESSTFTIGE